jgi:hypothetical protein
MGTVDVRVTDAYTTSHEEFERSGELSTLVAVARLRERIAAAAPQPPRRPQYDHGPYSKSVSQAEQVLDRLGLIRGDDGPLSGRAERIVAALRPEVDAYEELRSARLRVERWAQAYERVTLGRIIDEIYSLPVPSPFGGLVTVEDAPYEAVLVDPHERSLDLLPYQALFDLIWWKLTASHEEMCAMERVHSAEESARFFQHEADILGLMQR